MICRFKGKNGSMQILNGEIYTIETEVNRFHGYILATVSGEKFSNDHMDAVKVGYGNIEKFLENWEVLKLDQVC